MVKSIKTTGWIFIVLVVLAINGCGYKMGSMMHPQVKTIAFAPLKNETLVPMATAYMRKQLGEQFMTDGSLKIKSLETADCILYGRIVDIKTTETAEASTNGDVTYRAAQWRMDVRFEFVVLIPGLKKPLISKRQVVGNSSFDVTSDLAVGRMNGLDQACMKAAKKVVEYTCEAW